VLFGMAKQEVDELARLAEKWGMMEVKQEIQGLSAEDAAFADLPGFRVMMKQTPETKLMTLETLGQKTERMIAACKYPCDDFSIKKRNDQRKDLQARKEKLLFDFRIAIRALDQEQSVLDETKGVDTNIMVLKKEADTVERLTDPAGRTARIAAQRKANKEERAAFQAQKQYEAQALLQQQDTHWEATRHKRLKRNRMVDDEAEEVESGQED